MSIIHQLSTLIRDRQENPKAGSYTNELLDDPTKAIQKVGEEAVEVVVAALSQGPERLVSEAADLLYHFLVVLHANGVSWEEVEAELERRHKR